ncbi:transglycosylase SLT domain-containing protein [Haliovirga abyssi]|uniref:Membrane-bound lytic murein transglycosylase C n=1 Tax=Haliovirga abyssi TaxID=2996794 RepID=A0AAU9DC43_9FUSO|nr:transglycosylase SLT domain-containing protein [Haliovirga abyssi]BDU51051.1 membrane-bound lytic murein transglycosylase C [Haliovirga abyssi]
MKRILMLIICFQIIFIFSFGDDGFENYKKNSNKEYQTYKKNIEKEFKNYEKIQKEEFENYKKNILKNWKNPKVSSAKIFVEYDNKYSERKIVDFEKGEITIEKIVDKSRDEKTIKKDLAKSFSKLILEDTNTAFNRNEYLKNTEKRLNKKIKSPISFPIITDIYLKKGEKNIKKVSEIVIDKVKRNKLKMEKSKIKGKKRVIIKIKLPKNYKNKKALMYSKYIKKYSEKEKIKESLVYAIIQSESDFNPMSTSYVPAYGLMQIVPKSAGADATKKLYGKVKILTPKELYNAPKNIEIGAAYMNVLYYRYLRKINNLESRMYCTIAAYNTGAGNVSKAFIGNTHISRAIIKINKMSPKKVYNRLIKKLPYKETREYLKRVSIRERKWREVIK